MPRITARQKKAVRKPTAEFREETTSFCRPGIATLCHDCDFLVKSLLCEKYYRMRLVDKHAEGLGTANSELRHCPAKGPLPPIHHGPRTEPQAPRTYAPPPLTQIDPDPSTFPSNPVLPNARQRPSSELIDNLWRAFNCPQAVSECVTETMKDIRLFGNRTHPLVERLAGAVAFRRFAVAVTWKRKPTSLV